MHELLTDTAFGKLIRVLSGHRVLLYPEEYGSVASELTDTTAKTEPSLGRPALSQSVVEQSSQETVASQVIDTAELPNGNIIVVGWGPNDSEDPQNWSFGKKLLVSSLIWILTFAIYIGSAIYSPGIPGVATEFGVSTVASTLGLTLFVLGYGIGTFNAPGVSCPLLTMM
ncbi:GTPase-activating protein [Aspergillus melleus]|uniref:GTPase-activating protein n=1 Tax=Aspergillus melleus TaxID=138277 RepID=UPI001E8E3C19|nr:GTPase-activating protein [Aspergillus melleus]KAH8433853.1 GTPase-activating protein [Aspergillus melleus]